MKDMKRYTDFIKYSFFLSKRFTSQLQSPLAPEKVKRLSTSSETVKISHVDAEGEKVAFGRGIMRGSGFCLTDCTLRVAPLTHTYTHTRT